MHECMHVYMDVHAHAALTAPPYEVSEAGWGEFFLTARIFLVDESLPPVEMSHFLKVAS